MPLKVRKIQYLHCNICNTYINGYNITITNTLTNGIETYFTESLQLSYQSGSNETNPFTEIIVDIFAINTAGNGIISNISFYFPKGISIMIYY